VLQCVAVCCSVLQRVAVCCISQVASKTSGTRGEWGTLYVTICAVLFACRKDSSCPLQMSHFQYECVMFYINKSCSRQECGILYGKMCAVVFACRKDSSCPLQISQILYVHVNELCSREECSVLCVI